MFGALAPALTCGFVGGGGGFEPETFGLEVPRSGTFRRRRSCGVSYADSTGNLRLIADEPGLFIERAGATKDPWPSDETLRSLRARRRRTRHPGSG